MEWLCEAEMSMTVNTWPALWVWSRQKWEGWGLRCHWSSGGGGVDRPVSASLCYCGFCKCCQQAASVSCKKGEREDVCYTPGEGWVRGQRVDRNGDGKLIAVTEPRE